MRRSRAARGCTLAEDVVASQQPPRADRAARRLCRGRRRDRRCRSLCAGAACRRRRAVSTSASRCRAAPTRCCRSMPSRCAAIAPRPSLRSRRARACCPPAAMPRRSTPLRRAGERLRAIDIAVMAAAGIAEVTVRAPRIRIVCGGAARSPLIDAALDDARRVSSAMRAARARPAQSRSRSRRRCGRSKPMR